MPFTTRQIGPCFAAEVDGLDLREPLSPTQVAAVHQAMDTHAVLVFHDQHLTDEQHLAFSLALGDLEDATGPGTSFHLHDADEYRLSTSFADVSNLDKNQQLLALDDRRRLFAIGNRLWHSDSSFKVVPARYSMLRAIAVPSRGGNTEFADMRSAYDALDPDTMRRAEDLICEHSLMFSRMQLGFTDFTPTERHNFKPVRQRLIRVHPSTGRKSLFLASHAGRIVGWPTAEAMGFLMDLMEHATQRHFVYSHTWRAGDLVMWDNRATMHRVRTYPLDEPRDLRRTTLAGDGPTAPQVD
ncbi:MAG: TauD/TfdA family dioxygenase [Chloroflexi bacterium]|nr:TauD/TfdA family dioxygenase [Chloroflexota bacterium]